MADSAIDWIENEDQSCRQDRIDRLEWLADNFPASRQGLLLHGGWLTLQLLEEAKYCFAYGQYLATAVLGVAVVERILAAKFFASGRDDLERAGGQLLLREARRSNWISETEYDQIDKVRQLRNQFAHFRRPLSAGTVEHRAVQRECHAERIIEEDARRILSVVFGVLAKDAI